MPKVSVILSVHNGERFLGQAVRSILGQTFRDFELLIVDDASRDGTREIIESSGDPRIRLIANASRLGLTRSLNKALALAAGDIIARLDHDDFAVPQRLEAQVRFLDGHREVGAVGSDLWILESSGRKLRDRQPVDDLQCRWQLLFDSPIAHPASAYRAELATRLGGYDDNIHYAQDYDLWSRMAQVARLANIPEPLTVRRAPHEGSVTTKHLASQIAIAETVSVKNVRRLLDASGGPDPGWADEDIQSLRRLLVGGSPLGEIPDAGALPAMLPRLFTRFESAMSPTPDALGRVRRWIGHDWMRVASFRGSEDRRLAIRLAWLALGLSPGAALSPSMAKLALRLVGGRATDHLLHRLTGGRRGRRVERWKTIIPLGKAGQ